MNFNKKILVGAASLLAGLGLYGYVSAASFTLDRNSLQLIVGQSASVAIANHGYSVDSYYFSSNTNPEVASVSTSGNTVNVSALSYGSTNISVCQASGVECHNFLVLVDTGSVLGASSYKSGTLILEGGTVYLTYKDTKTGFANWDALIGLGYNPANILAVGPNSLTASLQVVNSANTAHPTGSWVKNGKTIYFVDTYGLVPISQFNVFLNNGGDVRNVVKANSYDMQKPQGSIMVLDDIRIK